jgi:flagellar protein FliJ
MKRIERLERINTINIGMENIAGANLANVQAEYAAQVNQLEQLKIYKAEYAEKFASRMNGQVTTQELQDYRYFFSSIDAAIRQQQTMVTHYQRIVEKTKDEWIARHQEVQKITQITDNLKRAEHAELQKKDQKLLDEITSHFFTGSAIGAKH